MRGRGGSLCGKESFEQDPEVPLGAGALNMQEAGKSAVRQKLAVQTRNWGENGPSINKRADKSAVAASLAGEGHILIAFLILFAQTAEIMHRREVTRIRE